MLAGVNTPKCKNCSRKTAKFVLTRVCEILYNIVTENLSGGSRGKTALWRKTEDQTDVTARRIQKGNTEGYLCAFFVEVNFLY